MDPELEQLIARLFEVAGSKGLSSSNDVTLVLEAPSTYENVQVVVSHNEPYNVTAPLNIVWLVADDQNSQYQKMLKRQSRIATAPYNHTWSELTTLNSVYSPSQIWDIPVPEDQDHVDHSNNIDNPHRTTAEQINALNLEGGTMTGPLLPRSDEPVDNFADEEVVPKSWIENLVNTVDAKIGGLQQGLAYVLEHLNITKGRVLNLENSSADHENRITTLENFGDTFGFSHNQTQDAASWTINHALNSTKVLVQVYDENNLMVIPDKIEIIDADNVHVVFAIPISGIAQIQPLALPVP